MGFIKAGGGDILNNFSHDRTHGTHPPPTPWSKKLSFMNRKPTGRSLDEGLKRGRKKSEGEHIFYIYDGGEHADVA